MAEHYDVIVVGGGPAGLAVALEARTHGFRVAVFEARHPPLEKACGEGLMPDGRARLEALGVELPEHRNFRGIHYFDGEISVVGLFPPGHAGAGVRRLALHRALLERAMALGVDLHWGRKVHGLTAQGILTSEGAVAARWVVGADGLLSHCRTWAGLAGKVARRRRFGMRRHFAVAPWSDLVEVHWGAGVEAYVTPIGAGEVGLAFLWSGGPAHFSQMLEHFPRLKAQLGDAKPTSPLRGAGPLEQKVRGVFCPAAKDRPALALVGDASGYLDAITGEGLSLAFHQAHALVLAMVGGDLSRYAADHRRIGRLPNALTHLTLALQQNPRGRRRVFQALAADPGLFEVFLAVHTRTASPLRLLSPSVAFRLAWRVITSRPAATPRPESSQQDWANFGPR